MLQVRVGKSVSCRSGAYLWNILCTALSRLGVFLEAWFDKSS